MIDIFSKTVVESAEERAGSLLAKKDLNEERHDMKKTDEDVFEDFIHNIEHPFMTVLRREAARYAHTGAAFVVRNRISVLIDDDNSDAHALYYNNGDTWRQSGDALVGKYLKELYPDLHMPGMKFGCKGEQIMLDTYPENFEWVREVYRKRAEKSFVSGKNVPNKQNSPAI